MACPSPPSSSSSAFMDNNTKYVRYSNEQVEALERLYTECPKPTALRRQQLIRDCAILHNIEPKQIKVWFQNRRCREKQRKESARLHNFNGRLNAMNKLLMEENDRLQKQVEQLLSENGYLRQQLQQSGISTADTSCDSVVTSGLQHLPTPLQPPHDVSNSGILLFAEKTRLEFLHKATGTAIDWIQMPGMKPGPDLAATINISHGCTGIAARACGLVGLEPARVVKLLKDRPSWYRDCRRLTTLFSTNVGTNSTVDVLYMQMYAPTTLAPARDFCTLRYTSIREDGSYVICESSFNGLQGTPTAPLMQSFVRAEMLPSGCLIQPCEGSGSIVIIVDHVDLEPWTVPEVLRPLYESPVVLAHRSTIAALRYLRHLAQESAAEVPGAVHQTAAVHSLNKRIAKGFDEAVNGFPEDGWRTMSSDGLDDISIVIKREHQSQLRPTTGGVLCAKTSVLLQNVSPASLVCFLREHRLEWADHIVATGSASIARIRNTGVTSTYGETNNSQALQAPIYVEQDEFLELIKMEGCEGNSASTEGMFLLQLCSGLHNATPGACAQMVFAAIDSSISDEVTLLPSGFRVTSLDSCVSNGDSPTLDLASTLDIGSPTLGNCPSKIPVQPSRSILTLAFQFTFETLMQESIASMARQYVRNVVSSIQRVAMTLTPFQISTKLGQPLQLVSGMHEKLLFARWICRSYKLHFGIDLVRVNNESSEEYFKALWQHSDAVMCCSYKSIPVFTFANQCGLEMLQTSSEALQELPWEKTLDEGAKMNVCGVFNQVMKQGYTCLPAGIRLSSLGRPTSYNRGVAWKVFDDEDGVHGVAFIYVNWSFVR